MRVIIESYFFFNSMIEVEKWVIQNNQSFFVKELMEKNKFEPDLNQTIENIKQAELELLAILESNQIQTEEEIL